MKRWNSSDHAHGWMPLVMVGLLLACSSDAPTTPESEPGFTMTVSGPIDTTFGDIASFSLSGLADSLLILRLMTYNAQEASGVLVAMAYTRAQNQYELPMAIRSTPFARFFLRQPGFFGSDTFPIAGSLTIIEHTSDRMRGSMSFVGSGLMQTTQGDTLTTAVDVSATFDAVFVR